MARPKKSDIPKLNAQILDAIVQMSIDVQAGNESVASAISSPERRKALLDACKAAGDWADGMRAYSAWVERERNRLRSR